MWEYVKPRLRVSPHMPQTPPIGGRQASAGNVVGSLIAYGVGASRVLTHVPVVRAT